METLRFTNTEVMNFLVGEMCDRFGGKISKKQMKQLIHESLFRFVVLTEIEEMISYILEVEEREVV